MTELHTAATAMLDAYGGDIPDWLLPEANALAQALATAQAERSPINHHMAAIEHMREAMAHIRQIGDARLASRVAKAQLEVDRAYGRAIRPHGEEVAREAHRLAELPDPVGEK